MRASKGGGKRLWRSLAEEEEEEEDKEEEMGGRRRGRRRREMRTKGMIEFQVE